MKSPLIMLGFLLATTIPVVSNMAHAADFGTADQCMVDRFNSTKPAKETALNCTANDVQLAEYVVVSGPTQCDPKDGQITVTLKGKFIATASTRWDVGAFIPKASNDPNAAGGACYNEWLHPVSTTNNDLDVIGGFGPYYNGELGVITRDGKTDQCGDIQQGVETFFETGSITIDCVDSNKDGIADLDTCTVWANSASKASSATSCQNELYVTAETTSKCTCGNVPISNLHVPVCGDGILDSGEACDDGNTIDGDGCESDCTLPSCGNGILDLGEACDDGNNINADGCEADCTLPSCGNGILDPGEACDDGNTANGDSCEANCTLPSCGNGILDLGEACDDGNNVNADGCEADCTLPSCGNGILDSGEACDDGNTANGDGCEANCTLPACGNGILDPGEACDDGNTTDGDGCEANCTLPVCGNGILDPGEACDDGNTANGDGCEADCTLPSCGNGILDPGEACDDGNNINADGCEADCTLPSCGNGILDPGEACDDGNTTDGDGCEANCTLPSCGNGILDPGEACDDGNTANGDGCEADCTLPSCGNGILDQGEACDDGNTVNGDGCSATCTIEVPPSAQITPTATTCLQFSGGTSPTLDTLNYSVKAGKVSQVSPGVFFYWVEVKATQGSNTFTIDQSIASGNFDSHYFSFASGSAAYTENCTKLNANITQSNTGSSNGDVTVTFNAASAGTYIIGIKYNAASVKGFTAPTGNPPTVDYTFEETSTLGSLEGLHLVKK